MRPPLSPVSIHVVTLKFNHGRGAGGEGTAVQPVRTGGGPPEIPYHRAPLCAGRGGPDGGVGSKKRSTAGAMLLVVLVLHVLLVLSFVEVSFVEVNQPK